MPGLEISLRVNAPRRTAAPLESACGHLLQAVTGLPAHQREYVTRALTSVSSADVDRLRYALEDLWNAL